MQTKSMNTFAWKVLAIAVLIGILGFALSSVAFAQTTIPDNDTVVQVNNEPLAPNQLERISWGAVLAGAVLAFVIQMALNLLGLSIGMTTVSPTDHSTPEAKTLGMSAVIWIGISTLIALFIGGWVAGRLSGMPDETDAALHGLLTWGVVTAVSTFFLTTSLGAFVSGAANLLGRGMALVGTGTAAAATAAAGVTGAAATGAAGAVSGAADTVSDSMDRRGITMNSIKQEAMSLLRQSGVPVDEMQNRANEAMQNAQGQAQDAAQNTQDQAQQTVRHAMHNPAEAEREMSDALSRMFNKGQQAMNDVERNSMVGMLTQRARMTEQDAKNMLRRWEQSYERAKAEAEQTAREAAEATAKAIAGLAAALFAVLVIGAIAAGIGGVVGAPEEIEQPDQVQTEGSVFFME